MNGRDRDRAANALLIGTSIVFAIVLTNPAARLLFAVAAVVALVAGLLREARAR